MFFTFGPAKEAEKDFGFIIGKHPDSVYEESHNTKLLRGKYDDNKQFFITSVINPPLHFLKVSREMNLDNYLHVQQSGVCPFNLAGFDKVLRACITGKISANITKEYFYMVRDMESIIGPYPIWEEKVKTTFEAFNITAEKLEDDTETAAMYKLTGNMSPTEFAQKIYLLSTFLTIDYDLVKISEEKIQKFVRLCEGWLDQCKDEKLKGFIVKRLSKFHKGFMQTFQDGLTDGKENTKLEEQLNIKHKSLHNRKHDLIVEAIDDCREEVDIETRTISEMQINTILDYGCGEGKLLDKLLKKFPKAKLRGIEANTNRIDRARRKVPYKVKIINQNILFPHFTDEIMRTDVLISCEVIEHLEESQRRRMLKIIRDIIQPSIIVLTTPNVNFNTNYDMEEGTLRHPDHKIEYTPEEFKNEVCDFLEKKYKIQYIDIIQENDEEWKELKVKTQPSFVIICEKIKGTDIDKGLYTQIQKMYAPVYLPLSGYEIRDKELENGYSSRPFTQNHQNIFFMSPTIPPVDYNKDYPEFLEHPAEAIRYYRSRGITEIIAEHKYMGSRAHVLVFKDKLHAEKMGFNKPIVVNSRGGYSYFSQDDADKHLDALYADIQPKMEHDFVILDCEAMPWAFKGTGLIKRQFRLPGDCTYLSRKYGKLEGLDNAVKFREALELFTKDTPMEFRMFQLLAQGSIKEWRGNYTFDKFEFGFTMNHLVKHHKLAKYEGDIFKPTEYIWDGESFDFTEKRWIEYCASGGEGFVIKPLNFMNYLENGYIAQPMIKVRGQDYLRIIYGIDYLDEDYFEHVCKRSIKRKRIMSIQQFEVSVMILRAFLQNRNDIVQRLVGGFIGMENWIKKNLDIDATL